MPLRFRRSIKIFPSLRLNLSKRGASASVGVRGAHVTVGHGQVRETVGLPGTGLSYTHVESAHQAHQEAPGEAQPPGVPDVLPKAARVRGVFWLALLVALVGSLALRFALGFALEK